MTYSELTTLIKQTALEVLAGRGYYEHSRRSDQSLAYNEPFPQIHLDPVSDVVDIQNDTINWSIFIGLLDQDTQDSSPEEREAIISKMSNLANEFLNTLNQNSSVLIQGINRTPVYRIFQATASGVILNFTLITKFPLC